MDTQENQLDDEEEIKVFDFKNFDNLSDIQDCGQCSFCESCQDCENLDCERQKNYE